jgi:hypothetical protein
LTTGCGPLFLTISPMPSRILQIQFVGGPYDGHIQPFGDPGLIQQLSLPVNENMLPLLKGEKLGPSSPINSLARYRMRQVGDDWKYEFVELISAKEIDFEAMRDGERWRGTRWGRGRSE